MKAISIHCVVRLGYDALETYRILWDLIRGPLIEHSMKKAKMKKIMVLMFLIGVQTIIDDKQE